jgi:hypothetical protein
MLPIQNSRFLPVLASQMDEFVQKDFGDVVLCLVVNPHFVRGVNTLSTTPVKWLEDDEAFDFQKFVKHQFTLLLPLARSASNRVAVRASPENGIASFLQLSQSANSTN